MPPADLVIEFVSGTRLRQEPAIITGLPIVGNGPPGTFVRFPGGREVPLPSDQIVELSDESGAARVGFGGMRFDGLEAGHLVFRRAREIRPERELSPERSRRMTLEPEMVAAIFERGALAWPTREQLH